MFSAAALLGVLAMPDVSAIAGVPRRVLCADDAPIKAPRIEKVVVKRGKHFTPNLTAHQKQCILQFLIAGQLTQEEIAGKVGCNVNQIAYLGHKHGIKSRRGRCPKRVAKRCAGCAKTFEVSLSRSMTTKYCNAVCWKQYRRVGMVK